MIVLILSLVSALAGAHVLTPNDARAVYAAYKIHSDRNRPCPADLSDEWFDASEGFGRPEWAIAAMNHVLPGIEGGDELARIFSLARTNEAGFRRAIDGWLRERSGLRLVTMAELRRELAGNRDFAFPIFDSPEDERKGFISHAAYTFAVAHGLFPIGDPHDLFFHVPSFLDPEFGATLKRLCHLIFETSVTPGRRELLNVLVGPTRDLTVENWSYVVADQEGRARVLLQGALPFEGLNAWSDGSGARLVPRDAGDLFTALEALPRWGEFAGRADVRGLLRDLAANVPALRALARVNLDALANPGDVDQMLRGLSKTATPALSRRLRHEVAQSLLVLLEMYRDFTGEGV